MALPTSSFRAPAEHHALVHAIAKALRRRPDLAEPLRLLLAQVAETDAPVEPLPDLAGLVRRMDAVERQVAEHSALLALRASAVVNADTAELPQKPPAGKPRPAKAPPEPWAVGEGRMKRLTGAGLAEIDRRLRAGESVAVIAEAVGVSQQTVSKRRAEA